MPPTDDEMANAILVTGAVYMALTSSRVPIGVEVETDDDLATNRLRLVLPFMRSAYHLTIERVPDGD